MDRVKILDGGMSRELQRLGAELRQPEWSAQALIDRPDIVRQVHDQFIQAGADVVTTNSYALVPFHIGEERFWQIGAELIARSGRLAREAADGCSDRKILVAGSLPPIFGSYEPHLFQPEHVQKYLAVLVQNLSPYVDVWLGETLSLIAEADAVRVATAQSGKPFWISFTLADGPDDNDAAPKLRSGERVTDAANWAVSSGASALLFNCSRPEVMSKAVKAASAVIAEQDSNLQIGVYANAFDSGEDGAANETLHAVRADLTEKRYNDFACQWVEDGANMVGGCCGIGAKHIHRLSETIRALR
ncbi:homocysteine S-methyltransferase family protein [Oryzifoliimicrobium ureilyticus]|uniref:homocysteine S-methyltransferase family protein n=1 Tax=Oryzifoliimicrobium ureilyticus TaxID=3113724 RepID=UPI0030766AD8